MLPRRALLIALLLVAALSFAKEKKKEEPLLRKVGVTLRDFYPPEGYNWRGSDSHSLSVIVWYPAEASAEEKEQYLGDPPMIYAGKAAKDAIFAPSFNTYPLVALSHGTGGSAIQMAWLGTYLAARGYIAVAVNHPGNNAATGYTPQGFAEGWERAKDISTVIDGMLRDQRFGTKIDPDRIGAAGFSYGGFTMMELAGATADFKGLLAWCQAPENHNACSPPEMPDLIDKFTKMQNQPEIKAALDHAGDSYRDPRIRAVFAIAPAIARAFSKDSLAQINIPVAIVAGEADDQAPVESNTKIFAAGIKGAQLTILPNGVGHYTFLDVGTDLAKKKLPQLFVDNPAVDRQAVHEQVATMAADFFDKELTPVKHKKK
ncbi:putative lipoprotein signal peptide [Candidatus Koribacter versatilis Ellin345]|uniref:Lipoprotein signal peptide n=1 Tax=Koribacter versatilis (strain Ellin345) TaxID=204669 RepID=Q1ITJ5_KORVE|nr:alpha/beta fold hydrolase [Candidatus Koribacter versatilis]ABF39805.1 putative lipoprotein signal peptide [Candidatus Koribacter versatilis Ellin345]